MKIYSIKDKATGFGNTFTASNDYAALRMFSDTINSEKNLLSEHPEDYQLYRLAEFDTDNGDVSPDKKLIEEAANLKK